MIMPAFKRCFSITSIILLIVAATLCNPCAAAQVPLEEVLPLLLDTTASCEAIPEIDRALGVDAFMWNEHEYLVGNRGNELTIWNIDEEQGPVLVAESSFEVGNQGDSDYDLLAFSVCDDCRFGIVNYKLGALLFDLGEGQTPAFVDSELYTDADVVRGGFTFQHDGQQFLVAADLPDECSATSSTVYAFDGILAAGLDQVTCIDADSYPGMITAGVYFTHQAQAYAYLANDGGGRLLVFEVLGPPESLVLDFKGSPSGFSASSLNGDGFEVDAAAELAVTANTSAVTLWSLADPALPVTVSTVDAGTAILNLAALRYPRLWVAWESGDGSSMTFDVTDPASPQPLNQGFWDPGHPWNSYFCTTERAGVFSGDSSVLYLARYGILQAISFGIFEDGFESGTTDMWSSSFE